MNEAAYLTTPDARYAWILRAVSRLGLLALVVGFLAYVAGFLRPRVLPRELPTLWAKPAHDYLAAANISPGWGWLAAIPHGDTAALAGIALIALSPLFAILGVLPIYLRQRDRYLAAVAMALATLLGLAASGLMSARA